MSISTTLRRNVPLTAAALAVVGVSACSSATSDSPEPTGQAPATTSSSTPAVTIDNPKNLKAVTDTCSLLNQQQLNELGLANVKPEHKDSILGQPACDWSGEKFAITISANTRTGGIDQLYKDQKDAKKTEVKSYPAAWMGKTNIMCRVSVGVAENASIAVNYTSNATSDEDAGVKPCQSGEKIAAMVLTNIPDA